MLERMEQISVGLKLSIILGLAILPRRGSDRHEAVQTAFRNRA